MRRDGTAVLNNSGNVATSLFIGIGIEAESERKGGVWNKGGFDTISRTSPKPHSWTQETPKWRIDAYS